MFAAVRNLSNSKWGLALIGAFLLAIAASFALADVQNVLGGFSGQLPDQTLAKAGDRELSEREFSDELQNQLTTLREENPTADYSDLADQFDPLLTALIQQKALAAFATGQGVTISKRLVDAEIAKLPQARGLDGKFDQNAYLRFLQAVRLTDAQLRRQLEQALLNRVMLTPLSADANVPVGVARPYAAMQLEVREADIALIPTELYLAKVGNPTSAQIQAFYKANAKRYTVPEQRVLDIAPIGAANVADVVPTDKEIAEYFRSNQDKYGAKKQRVISQVVVPTKVVADQLAGKLRSGTSFVEAAKPLGYSAEDISVGPQTRDQFADLTADNVAAAAFASNVGSGAIVGPVRSDLGFHVIKVDAVQDISGKTLAEARGEIVAELTEAKRKNALADLINRVEDEIADGASFKDAVRSAGLQSIRTPPITASGRSRSDPDFRLPPEYQPVLQTGFDLASDEDPLVETLPGESGYALVGVDRIIPAAPAPLAEIRDQVIRDWKQKQARDRARKVATAITNAVAKGQSLAVAVREAKTVVSLPAPEGARLRRLELARMGGNVPPALSMMFSLAEGRSRMVADPEGRGFIIVNVTKITPGDVTLQPGLVSQLQQEFGQALSSEYAEQFVRAVEREVGVKRNPEAIEAARQRLVGGTGS